MPVDRRAVWQLGLLLLAVPTQYMITRYITSTDGERTIAIKSILKTASQYKDNYLSWDKWQKWCVDMMENIKNLEFKSPLSTEEDDRGESPAVEVMKYRDPEGWFAGSTEPRSPRPPHVKYRVGQVIRHKQWGYRGVIIGWDVEAKEMLTVAQRPADKFLMAPESWLNEMHPKDKPHWRKLPNYSVLVDTRDRMSPQRTYVAEENIEVVSATRVIHPWLEDYFENFDGSQYLPRPGLKKIYPHD